MRRVLAFCISILFFIFLSSALSSAALLSGVSPKDKEKQAELYFKRGIASLAKDQLNEAEKAFKESNKQNPNMIGSLLGLAEVALRRGDQEKGEKYLQNALSKAPENSSVLMAWGRYLFSQKRFTEAEKAFKKAITLDPKGVKPRVSLGSLYLNGFRKPRQAINVYREALAVVPEHAGIHYGLGLALAAVDERDKAIVELKEAGRLAPKNPLAFQALGRLYVLRKEFDEALEAFADALKAEPGFIQAYIDRGDIFMVRGKYEKAFKEYSEVLKVNNTVASAHVKIGLIHQKYDRVLEAEKSYLDAIKHNPKQVVAYNNLAWILAEQKIRLDEALEWAKKAVELKPEVPQFLDTLGWVYRARGELDQAVSVLGKISDSGIQVAEVFYHLGIAHQERGDTKDAILFLKKALKLKKDFAKADDAKRRLSELGGL